MGDSRPAPPGSGSVDRARDGHQGRESALQIDPLPAPIGLRSDFPPFGGVNGRRCWAGPTGLAFGDYFGRQSRERSKILPPGSNRLNVI